MAGPVSPKANTMNSAGGKKIYFENKVSKINNCDHFTRGEDECRIYSLASSKDDIFTIKSFIRLTDKNSTKTVNTPEVYENYF